MDVHTYFSWVYIQKWNCWGEGHVGLAVVGTFNIFQSDYTNLYPQSQYVKAPVYPHPHQNLVISVLLILVSLVCLVILVEVYCQVLKLQVRGWQTGPTGQIQPAACFF